MVCKIKKIAQNGNGDPIQFEEDEGKMWCHGCGEEFPRETMIHDDEDGENYCVKCAEPRGKDE